MVVTDLQLIDLALLVVLEVGTGQLVLEEECDIWHGLQCVQESFIETSPIGCVDRLTRSALVI